MKDDAQNRNYQIYNNVSPKVEQLLAQSLKNFEGDSLRPVYCPRCHMCLEMVGTKTTGFLKAKCPKCKHEDILDLRIFRTAKTKQGGPKVKPLPAFIPGWINFLRQDLF